MTMETVCVFGLGMSGSAVVRFLLDRGTAVRAIDRPDVVQKKFQEFPSHPRLTFFGETDPEALLGVDFLVLSPGIPRTHPLLQRGIPVVGEAELAAKHLPHPAMGITGTNGKTTVTALTDHLLRSAGIASGAFGNIGRPLIEAVSLPSTRCVVELSSYQLELLETPFLDAACLLNIAPDHLDRYPSFDAYRDAKWRLFQLLKPDGKAFVHEELFKEAKEKGVDVESFGFLPSSSYASDGQTLFEFGTPVAKVPQALLGKQDFRLQNFLAAYALCRTQGLTPEQIGNGYATFLPLPHRLELLGSSQGISFYNDTKATNVSAVCTALQAIDPPLILLAGGRPKGESFTPWRHLLQKKGKAAIVFGEAAPLIAKELSGGVPLYRCPSLSDAFTLSLNLAEEGDSVVLSPGCASFDEFENYMKRGEAFSRLVQNWFAEGEIR